MDGVDAKPFFKIPSVLKKQNKALKVAVVLRGWTFNDFGFMRRIFYGVPSSHTNI